MSLRFGAPTAPGGFAISSRCFLILVDCDDDRLDVLIAPALARRIVAQPKFLFDSDVGDELPACETVLDIIGDLFAHGRQLKHLVFDDRIVSLLGKLSILGCLVPEIVRPVHAVQSDSRGRDSERMAKGRPVSAQNTTISGRPTPRRRN
jgi:hypothetical protein